MQSYEIPPSQSRTEAGPAAHTPERPTLADLLHARNDCRSGLAGLRVRVRRLGLVTTIRHTMWNEHSRLDIYLDTCPGLVASPEELVLLDRWKVRCCRPSAGRLREALARRAAGRGRP